MNHRISNQISLGRATALGYLSGFALLLCGVAGLLLPVVAQAENCPNAPYRTGPSAALPDCRAYELVSPPEKNAGYINQGFFSSSPEGLAVTFTSNAGFAGAASDINASTGYQSTRGSGGWGTAAETENEAQYIDHHGVTDRDFAAVSFGDMETRGDRELEGGVRLWQLQSYGLPEADLDLYLTRDGGPNELVGPTVPPTSTDLDPVLEQRANKERMGVLGMSADASHIVFEDPEPEGPNQWSFAAPGALLEYVGADHAEPKLVVPDPATEDDSCSTQSLAGDEGGGGTHIYTNVTNPISTYGEKIFFTVSGTEPQCKGQLFAGVDSGGSTAEGAHTVAISEPTTGDCAKCDTEPAIQAGAEFLGASENGTKVFFYTTQPLLNGQGGLYEYDFAAPEGNKVTQVALGAIPNVTELPGYPRAIVSQDGSHVYFVSESVLTGDPSPDAQGDDSKGDPVTVGAVAQSGAQNLYSYEQDELYPHGHISFVAVLDPNRRAERSFDLTPNGQFLVLSVRGELTHDDTTLSKQIFEYDAQTHGLTRVSIGDDGYNNNGNAAGFDANIPGKTAGEGAYNPSAFLDTLVVSEDGAYVFFQSGDGLTPGALNRVVVGTGFFGQPISEPTYAQNVYEYHAGHVYLISDGQDISTHSGVSQVHLLSTDLSGKDVFFETTDQLVGQDTDSNKDFYDARIEGGFPAPVRPPACSGDACQGALSASPVLLSPGSESQAGGNPPVAPAPGAVVKAKPKALTNAQRLAAALKGCHKKAKSKRAACETKAHKQFGPLKKAKQKRRG